MKGNIFLGKADVSIDRQTVMSMLTQFQTCPLLLRLYKQSQWKYSS